MSNIIVSVIVPTKNSANTLPACLKSIVDQTWKDTEIIVIDNFSTDATPSIAKQYADMFEQKGPERSAQRNYGVEIAKGNFVLIIDSDMKLSPTVIADCVRRMNADSGIEGVIIPEESYGEGFWAQCKKLERSFYVGVDYMEAARFFRRSSYQRAGGYDEGMVSGEDWDLSQRINKFGSLGRVSSFIYHNEGRISLRRTIHKKYFYAQQFAAYTRANKESVNVEHQTSVLGRYRLFFSKPSKLFRNPLLGIGMLFMKTCEFGFGAAGYLMARTRR